ncbi:MAG: 50S ribosomal protein L33 [Bacilli bacterium]|jgi:large subunit ribosomal protein L33|nr:50S ribosomal protein L33 [Bacilli bacterium]
MAEARTEITMACSVCGNENYITTKNKKTVLGRFEEQKYCPHCRKKTLHKEKK